jgi:hypothetical protein
MTLIMDEALRNHEIASFLDVWEWCSRTLHVKWRRKRMNRNSCLMGMAFALSKDAFVSPMKLPSTYQTLPVPLFDKVALLRFWTAQPVTLLELCLGVFTKDAPLKERLNEIRLKHQDNPRLDEAAKKMRAREKRFQGDWPSEGHHSEADFSILKEGIGPILAEIGTLIVKEPATVDKLAREVLAQGPWKPGELSAYSIVRKTPENLLNRTTRLSLWRAARDVRILSFNEEEALQMLYEALHKKITLAIKSAIESEGYSVQQVIDDVLNFDMHKTQEEIT